MQNPCGENPCSSRWVKQHVTVSFTENIFQVEVTGFFTVHSVLYSGYQCKSYHTIVWAAQPLNRGQLSVVEVQQTGNYSPSRSVL